MNEETQKPRPVLIPEMCATHQQLLVHQLGFSEDDPWRALIIVAQIALFQACTCDPEIFEKYGPTLHDFSKMKCMACEKPDKFGELIAAALNAQQYVSNGDMLGAIKALGEQWIEAELKKRPQG